MNLDSIEDVEQLAAAIKAAKDDATRKALIGVAQKMKAGHMIPDSWAGDGSLKQANREALSGVREVRRLGTSDFELRDGGPSGLTFTGYASVTGRPYERSDMFGQYAETIAPGAFKRTLGRNPDVAFLVNHNDLNLPLARTKSGTLKLAEDSTGLHSEARFDPSNPAVMQLRSAVERGDVDEMSFAFRVDPGGQEWSPDYTERRITSVDLNRGDVSLVNAGSNPFTAGSVNLRSYADALRELRLGATISQQTLSTLSQVLDLVARADDCVDQAQPILADLMGVPNPDADDSGAADDDSRSFRLTLEMAEFLLGK